MKLAIRILALTVVLVGGAAAAVTPKPAHAISSRQSATASFPVPQCGPGICPVGSGSN